MRRRRHRIASTNPQGVHGGRLPNSEMSGLDDEEVSASACLPVFLNATGLVRRTPTMLSRLIDDGRRQELRGIEVANSESF
jgi:hypothetical protein